MRFGIYAEMQCPDGKSHKVVYDEIIRQMVHADQVGFDAYSTIEHHFFQNFGISANPLALFSAVAQKTERIRFRTALHTLPFHNPLRLAGEIAVADILTGGRLECGIGRGHAWLFGPLNVPLEESRPRYDEAIEVLVKAWTEEHIGVCFFEASGSRLEKRVKTVFLGLDSEHNRGRAGPEVVRE